MRQICIVFIYQTFLSNPDNDSDMISGVITGEIVISGKRTIKSSHMHPDYRFQTHSLPRHHFFYYDDAFKPASSEIYIYQTEFSHFKA